MTFRHVASGIPAMCRCLLPVRLPAGPASEGTGVQLNLTVDKMISLFALSGHQPEQLEVKFSGLPETAGPAGACERSIEQVLVRRFKPAQF